jgi:ribonuclease J
MRPQPGYHASGHAGRDELCEFVRRVAPKHLVPIHTEAPHLWRDMLAWQSIHLCLPHNAKPISF